MIECNLDNHKDIFYSVSEYAKHILLEHKKAPVKLKKWAKNHIKRKSTQQSHSTVERK